MAVDSAREANDHQATAMVRGYSAQLAHAEGVTAAALDQLTAALTHAECAPAIAPWLATILATIHAGSGDHTAVAGALHRAESTACQPATQPTFLADHGRAHLAAATGHAYLQAVVTYLVPIVSVTLGAAAFNEPPPPPTCSPAPLSSSSA